MKILCIVNRFLHHVCLSWIIYISLNCKRKLLKGQKKNPQKKPQQFYNDSNDI